MYMHTHTHTHTHFGGTKVISRNQVHAGCMRAPGLKIYRYQYNEARRYPMHQVMYWYTLNHDTYRILSSNQLFWCGKIGVERPYS